MINHLLHRLLLCLPPEMAHRVALNALRIAHRMELYATPPLSDSSGVEVMGLHFPNRLGLAAGMDKNGEYIQPLAALGFGFIEIGTVTPLPQPGNPKPRLFRLPKAQAIINRMGFNNRGVDYLVHQVQQAQFDGILGINIGKNLSTPLERAAEDYLFCLQRVYPYASYVTINLSSPNTSGLRQLQYGETLNHLLERLKREQRQLQQQHDKWVPLVVKIAPDLDEENLTTLAMTLREQGIEGVIATNTTISRERVSDLPHAAEMGGLSGQPLFHRSLHTVKQLHQVLQGSIPIIGCGGIQTPEQATELFTAGAQLIQLYTSLIYHGTHIVSQLSPLHPEE